MLVTSRPSRAVFLLPILLIALPASAARAQENDLCLMCHAEASVFEGLPNADSLVVSQDELSASIHGQIGLMCVDCHQDLMGSEDFPHSSELSPPDCSICHYDVVEVYNESLHGYAQARGNERAPTCGNCHGTHDILPSYEAESPTNKSNIQATCAQCHGESGLSTDQFVKLPQTVSSYAQSVHGRGIDNGITNSASCTDCHGVHDLKGSLDPSSKINHRNVAATCGQCHSDIRSEYDRSIHGRALQAGVADSPTCNNCHGEHLILSPNNPEAATYATKQATETCGACHDDPEIIEKYSIRGGVVGSYTDSYHGWASKRNYKRSATCVSCHTAHLVLPEADPESTIHADNLVGTCQQCHEDADATFANSYTHIQTSITTNPLNRTIRGIYIFLIVAIIGGMVLHNLAIFNFYLFERRKQQLSASYVTRMDGFEVFQHILLAVSFIGLVITGFALRFPDEWWVNVLSWLGMTEPVRGTIHRVLAVVLIGVSVIHLYEILFTKRGRVQIKAMLPGIDDVGEALDSMKYHTWTSKKEPRFSRFDYTQKAEYWALVWGTVVMVLTGFVLWFPETAVKVFPSWIVMVSQTVHYYEAWLATLAILVWHGFFTVLHPREYPMSWTWLTGRMPVETVKHHHSKWYEDEIATGEINVTRGVEGEASEPTEADRAE